MVSRGRQRAEDTHRPVTLDLNGRLIVRAKPLDSDQPTEVVLSSSSYTGEPCG